MSSLRPRPVADAPSRHAVGLGQAVHGQRAILQIGGDLRHGRERLVAIDDVLVDVVAEDPYVRVPAEHLRESFQIRRRVHPAGRVARIVENQPLRPVRDRRVELFGREAESVGGVGGDHDRIAARDQGHVGVAHPVRRGDDDFALGVERRGQRVVDHLLAAVAHEQLVGGVAHAVLALELAADGLAKLGDAGDRRVLRLALDDGSRRRELDVVRGVEIRLPRRKGDDVATGPRHLHRLGGDDDRGRRLDTAHALCGDGHHKLL